MFLSQAGSKFHVSFNFFEQITNDTTTEVTGP